MKLTPQEVRHVAKLARLHIAPQAVEKLADQLASILDYVEKMNEVDTRDVTATSHAVALTNALREDEVHDHLTRESALDNAPLREAGSFVVPKVI